MLESADRVLLLGVPAGEELRRLAASVPQGLLVVLDVEEAIRPARQSVADLDNVMCVFGAPEEIPWRAEFFSVVTGTAARVSDARRATQEIARVLAPDGRILLADASGLTEFLAQVGRVNLLDAPGQEQWPN